MNWRRRSRFGFMLAILLQRRLGGENSSDYLELRTLNRRANDPHHLKAKIMTWRDSLCGELCIRWAGSAHLMFFIAHPDRFNGPTAMKSRRRF